MRFKQFLITPLALCFGLASCKSEREATGTSAGEQSESETFSGAPPSAHTEEKPNLPRVGSDQSEESFSATQGGKLSDEGKLLYEKLMVRARMEKSEVFNVPLPEQASKDRSEAWEKLAVPDNHRVITKEQRLYADRIVDRYSEAPQLEKLVFWRLINLRLNNQLTGSISIIVGEDNRQLIVDSRNKLMAMLYSAIGETPETLPDFLAYRKGVEMLQAASGEKSPDR